MTQKIKELDEKRHTISSVCSHTGTVMIYHCIIYETAQDMPDKIIGANKVSLNTAKKNYRLLGAIEGRFIDMVRLPHKDEL